VSFRSIVKGTSEEIEFDVAKLVLSVSIHGICGGDPFLFNFRITNLFCKNNN